MLEGVWGKENLCSVLVELQTSAVTLEISVENLQKAKNKSAVPLLGKCPKSLTSYSIDVCSAMFAAALFTIVRK